VSGDAVIGPLRRDAHARQVGHDAVDVVPVIGADMQLEQPTARAARQHQLLATVDGGKRPCPSGETGRGETELLVVVRRLVDVRDADDDLYQSVQGHR
jgi:hypothetical protein